MSGKEYSYHELVEALNAEAASIPEDTWRDGAWNVNDYIIEASQVGIIKVVHDNDDDAVESPDAQPGQ